MTKKIDLDDFDLIGDEKELLTNSKLVFINTLPKKYAKTSRDTTARWFKKQYKKALNSRNPAKMGALSLVNAFIQYNRTYFTLNKAVTAKILVADMNWPDEKERGLDGDYYAAILAQLFEWGIIEYILDAKWKGTDEKHSMIVKITSDKVKSMMKIEVTEEMESHWLALCKEFVSKDKKSSNKKSPKESQTESIPKIEPKPQPIAEASSAHNATPEIKAEHRPELLPRKLITEVPNKGKYNSYSPETKRTYLHDGESYEAEMKGQATAASDADCWAKPAQAIREAAALAAKKEADLRACRAAEVEAKKESDLRASKATEVEDTDEYENDCHNSRIYDALDSLQNTIKDINTKGFAKQSSPATEVIDEEVDEVEAYYNQNNKHFRSV